MYDMGVIGPNKDYLLAYAQNVQMHNLSQLVSSFGNKKFRYKKPSEFEEMYNNAYKWMTLGNKPEKEDYQERMFQEMMDIRGGDTPEWVIDSLIKEDEDG